MKNTSYILISLFFYVLPVHSQVGNQKTKGTITKTTSSLGSDFLGRPRTPLSTSFYSKDMWEYDGRRVIEVVEHKDVLSLLELVHSIKTNGRTIVYDGSVASFVVEPGGATPGIYMNDNSNVLIRFPHNDLQIPIVFSGEGPITLSEKEKGYIYEYVRQSLSISGTTPSQINIISKNTDFDIKIYKSHFIKDDAIVEAFNIRSKVEKEEAYTEINQLLDEGRLEKAEVRLQDIMAKYAESNEFNGLKEKLESISFAASENKRKSISAVRYIEENETGFSVYDGVSPKKQYDVMNKEPFIDELANSVGNKTRVVYLDVKGLNSQKAMGFITSVQIQLRSKLPHISIKRIPEDRNLKEVYFKGTVLNEITEGSYPTNDYSAIRTYNVSSAGKTWKIGLGIEVNTNIVINQSRKIISSFYSIFGKSTKKVWTLSDAVYNTRRHLEKKYKSLKPEDYENFVRNEAGIVNIVFIEKMQ